MIEGTRSRWPEIVLVYCLSVLAVMVISEAAPALGGIAGEFRPRSPAAIGWVMSIPALVAALAALLIGTLVDRVGDRLVLIAGGVALIAGDGGVVLARGLPALLAWRIVGGFGYVCMSVAAVTLVTRITRGRERTAALALWSTVIPASFVVSFLASAMLAGLGRWRAIFVAHAIVTVALLLAARFLLPRGGGEAPAPSRLAAFGEVVRSPWPYLLGLSFAANAFLQTGAIASVPRLLAIGIGASEAQVQPFNIPAMLINMLGALAVGALLNRGARAWIVAMAGLVLCGIAGLGLALAPTALLPAMAMQCALMLGCGLLVGMWALLPVVAPSPRTIGATSGLLTQITLVGVLFGPPAAFLSLARGPGGFVLFLALALAGSLLGAPVWFRVSPGQAGRFGHGGLGAEPA